MIRVLIPAIVALTILAIAQEVMAQGSLPFSNVQQSPTVSPYLNLLSNRTGAGAPSSLPAYQTLVQPLLQQQQQAAVQQGQISNLQKQTSALSSGAGLANPARGASTSIRGTGHVTAFMETSHYYPHYQGHSAGQ